MDLEDVRNLYSLLLIKWNKTRILSKEKSQDSVGARRNPKITLRRAERQSLVEFSGFNNNLNNKPIKVPAGEGSEATF